MLTIEHYIALSGLSPEEVAALAEHDHLPDIVAAEPGNYLVCSEVASNSCAKFPDAVDVVKRCHEYAD